MSEYISKFCEPCLNGHNSTIDATKYCVACEESYYESCSIAHKTQKATRSHDLTNIEHFLDSTTPLESSTVCEPCLENRITMTTVSRCLECEESYCENCARIHKSQVTDFQTENKRSACEACSYNGIEDRSTSVLCITCDKALCVDCTKAHKSQKATRMHQMEDKNPDMQPPNLETGQTASTKARCCDHCNDKKKATLIDEAFWFCFNCRQALCKNEHKNAPEASNHRIIHSTEEKNGNEVQTHSSEGSQSSPADSIPEEIIETDKRKGCGCCDTSDNEDIAGFCLECKVQLCPACVTQHGQVEDTNSHRLLLNHKQQDESINNEKQPTESEITVETDPGSTDVESATAGVKYLCQLCKEQGLESPVVAFCFDCLRTLCDQCAIKHAEDQATKIHKIMSKNDGNQYSNKRAVDNKPEIMPKPEENDLNISSTRPGKPMQVGALKVDSVTITWKEPKELYDAYCYQIRYKEDKYDAKWQFYEEEKSHNVSLTVKNIKSHSCFVLQVRMINNESEGQYSEISDSIETIPSAAELVYNLSHEVSDLGCQLKLRQFRLNENSAARNSQLKTRKMMLGDDKTHHKTEKTILLLGASGTGKTTFVNGLVNFLFGVTFADGFRFSIVDAEEDEKYAGTTVTMVTPKTQWITCYSITPVKGSKLGYRLTIIDTPGFGDKGIEKDAGIKQQLKELFSAVDEKGVLFVDAVCIFMRASESRLTVTQEYIYTTITSLFHRDIEENICSIVTFSDGKTPPVLSALKEANLPYETYFPFNTSEIFSDNLQTSQTSLTKVFFEMNGSSFELFLKKLTTLKTKSLSQSNDVLQKRQQIKETAEILLSKVGMGLNKMEDCRSEIAVLEKFKTQMTDNKDFKYKRQKHVQKHIPLQKGLHTTNCLHCNVTCHDNCAFANDEYKARCVAMDSNGYCQRCEDHCYWDKHKNTPFIIEWVQVEEEGTYDEMLQKYQEASDEVVTHEAIVTKMKKELDEVENEMLDLMKKIADCSNQLSQIALRANPLSVAEHIDIIIENEKWERKPGFQERINNLEKLKKRISVGEEFEQFQKSKDDIHSSKNIIGHPVKCHKNFYFTFL